MQWGRRVVVTGLGMVTPLGTSAKESWSALVQGRTGVRTWRAGEEDAADDEARRRLQSALPVRIAAQVDRDAFRQRFDRWIQERMQDASTHPTEASTGSSLPRWNVSDCRRAPLSVQYALLAAEECLLDARWPPHTIPDWERGSVGVMIGTGMSSLPDMITAVHQLPDRARVSPYFVPRVLLNAPAGYISLVYGFRGPNTAPATACAAGAHAIGEAYRCIQRGDTDVCLAGGTEACIHALALAGFARARALSTRWNERPEYASRPFDRQRDGFVLGEGACVLLLEEEGHARRRGLSAERGGGDGDGDGGGGGGIYGEVIGYGTSADAYHLTASHPEGDGALLCMQRALRDVSPAPVGYVNAHATSTPLGDRAEALALGRVFAQQLSPAPLVSSTKGVTGHLLGAAGALEAAFTLLTMRDRLVPVNRNLEAVDAELMEKRLNVEWVSGGEAGVAAVPVEAERVQLAMSNSFGFYGTNTTLVFRDMSTQVKG